MKRTDLIQQLKDYFDGFPEATNYQRALMALDVVEIAGMKPPYSKQADLGCECGCKGINERGRQWDK